VRWNLYQAGSAKVLDTDGRPNGSARLRYLASEIAGHRRNMDTAANPGWSWLVLAGPANQIGKRHDSHVTSKDAARGRPEVMVATVSTEVTTDLAHRFPGPP
jgi:hypothetical protein